MRTYGRIKDDSTPSGYRWVQVVTDAQGFDDGVWVTTLAQCLQLVLGESPFYANYGIPVMQALIQQIFPDYYVAQTQAQFSQYFASLTISKVADPDPVYDINVITQQGSIVALKVPV